MPAIEAQIGLLASMRVLVKPRAVRMQTGPWQLRGDAWRLRFDQSLSVPVFSGL